MSRIAPVLAVALVLGQACAATKPAAKLQVRTEYAKDVVWSEMRSFRMASRSSGDPGYQHYPRLEKIVSDALVAQLTDRGFQRIEEGTTEFRVAFELIFRGDTARSADSSPYGSEAVPATAKGSGQTSSLVVRMLDPVTSRVLWEGRVAGFKIDGIKPETALTKAVWRVLAEFPPITG